MRIRAYQQNGLNNLSKIVSLKRCDKNTQVEAGCYALFSNKSTRLLLVCILI